MSAGKERKDKKQGRKLGAAGVSRSSRAAGVNRKTAWQGTSLRTSDVPLPVVVPGNNVPRHLQTTRGRTMPMEGEAQRLKVEGKGSVVPVLQGTVPRGPDYLRSSHRPLSHCQNAGKAAAVMAGAFPLSRAQNTPFSLPAHRLPKRHERSRIHLKSGCSEYVLICFQEARHGLVAVRGPCCHRKKQRRRRLQA